jgi:hypothetical protein
MKTALTEVQLVEGQGNDSEAVREHQPSSFDALAALLGPFGRRCVEEAITQAMPAHWEHRAEQLEAARPRLGDFLGKSTLEERARRDRDLAEAAAACREHAQLLRMYPDDEGVAELVETVWDELERTAA